MAGCGYVCPQCEGSGFTDNGEVCDWCSASQTENSQKDLPLPEALIENIQ
jgi:hypothetical protein